MAEVWTLQGAKATPGAPLGLRLSGDLRNREKIVSAPQTPRVLLETDKPGHVPQAGLAHGAERIPEAGPHPSADSGRHTCSRT